MQRRTHFDAVIIGGGPVGAVLACAFARRGQPVLVLEAAPQAAHRRFAGEWLHPTAVAALHEARATGSQRPWKGCEGEGFAVFPDDGGEPIVLPYGEGLRAWTGRHGDLVESLRNAARGRSAVHWESPARATRVDGHRVTWVDGRGHEHEVSGDVVVGCDGRNSIVRRALGLPPPGPVISQMAGVLLRGVELPVEGYGHVFLGGPGPVLAYRLDDDTVRLCLDVPELPHGDARSRARWLDEQFGRALPASMRPALSETLRNGRVEWAANRFTPRATFGTPPLLLAGDAAGHCHPLTAAGMALGFADAAALPEATSAAQWATSREAATWTPELLANALYVVFTGRDAGAALIRAGVFDWWRRDEHARRETMRLLMGVEDRPTEFARAFVRAAVQAARQTVRSGTPTRPAAATRALATLLPWARWPLAGAMPRPLRRALRPNAVVDNPFARLATATARRKAA